MSESNRIEYIDALRGFVMLLVVLGHVPMYCYHHLSGISFSTIPSTFHLALFFFISGWFVNSRAVRNADATLRLRYDNGNGRTEPRRNGITELRSCGLKVREKFVQLIVPTMVFFLLYCWLFDIDIIENLWDDKYKSGYWFCIVLFCFYVILTLTLTITVTRTKTKKLGGALLCLILAAVFLMFNTNAVTRLLTEWHIPNLLCLQQWQYFIFFYMGHMAHRYQEQFFDWLDNGRVMAAGILLFFGSLFAYYHQPVGLLEIKMAFILWGGLGSVLSFAFFRKYKDSFSRETYIGRTLQYIGRRTLDVYLLHFFFLPKSLSGLGVALMGNGNQTVELFVSLAIAMIVIALCLLMGNIIRLSPQLAHWVLGAKRV